tara:strand:- start:1359 stop:1496 length:138 start_codon:yes stop_codon:yes gene_type:complete
MFTIIIQLTDSGQFIDIEFENAPTHIPIKVKEQIIDDVNTEFEEE